MRPAGTLPSHGRAAGRRLPRRRGVTILETALVLGLFLLVVLGTLDLGLTGIRQNVLSDAGRRMARYAALRGAESTGLPLGPQTLTGAASDLSDAAQSLRPWLATMAPSETFFRLEWIDGGNQPGQRLRVTVWYDHRTLVPLLPAATTRRLQSSTTLLIAH